MSRADLHLVADTDPERSLGDAIAWAYGGDATQDAIDRATDWQTRNEDDDYGDVDGGYRQQHTADLRDALRRERRSR